MVGWLSRPGSRADELSRLQLVEGSDAEVVHGGFDLTPQEQDGAVDAFGASRQQTIQGGKSDEGVVGALTIAATTS